MTAARAAGVKTSAGKRALRLGDDALTAARSLLRPGQLRPQTRVLGSRRGHLGPQACDLVLTRIVAPARLSRRMRPQQIAVRLGDRNHLLGEGILPEHLADLLFDLLAIEPDVLLGLRERPIDGGASTRLAVPLPHRLVHQVGVGALLRRHLGRRRGKLTEQRAALRLLGHRLARVRPRPGSRKNQRRHQGKNCLAHFHTPVDLDQGPIYAPGRSKQHESRQVGYYFYWEFRKLRDLAGRGTAFDGGRAWPLMCRAIISRCRQ